MKLHPLRLRRLHNPECIDTAEIPRGFRLLYEDELPPPDGMPLWFRRSPAHTVWMPSARWGPFSISWVSYITLVAPTRRGLPTMVFHAYIPGQRWRRA